MVKVFGFTGARAMNFVLQPWQLLVVILAGPREVWSHTICYL